MSKSKLYRFNWLDFLKGLILAVGTPLLYFLQEILPTMGLSEWQKIALSAIVAYLIKQFFTNQDGKMFSKDGDTIDDVDIAGGGIKNPKP